MFPIAPFLMLATVQDSFAEMQARTDAEDRQAARQIFEQLLSEDEEIYLSRAFMGRDKVGIQTRPRASSHSGICQIDRLEIERHAGGAIREVETIHRFLIVTGPGGKPQWDLTDEPLEKSCAAAGESDGWFTAPEAFAAEAAVIGLLGLKEALSKPDPAPGVWGCRRRKACADPKAIGERITPLNPGSVVEGGHGGVPCPEGEYCVSVVLADTDCSSWVTQLRLDRSSGFRFRSARASYQLNAHHCGIEWEMLGEG
jgi:hypothetical protein